MAMIETAEFNGSDVNADLRLRSAASTYVVFTVIVGIPMLFMARAALIRRATFASVWQLVALAAAALVGFILYFGYLEVTVSRGVLRYRTLFGTRSVFLSDIARSQFRWNIASRDPRPFLIITLESGGEAL